MAHDLVYISEVRYEDISESPLAKGSTHEQLLKGNKKSVFEKADFLLDKTEGKIDPRVDLSFCFWDLVLPIMLRSAPHHQQTSTCQFNFVF